MTNIDNPAFNASFAFQQTSLSAGAIEAAVNRLERYDGYNKNKFTKIGHKFDQVAAILHDADVQLQLDLSAEQHVQLLHYLDTLLLWNKTYNLTAISEPIEACVKHLVDCLSIIPCLRDDALNLSTDELFDIGTGAGLPAVIVAICQPERICTALDSNQKKIRFIKQVSSELKLTNVVATASRIQQHTGEYALITSRAFASLQDFVDLANPYLAADGQLIAMKGKIPLDEIETLSSEWQIDSIPLKVPFLADSRHIIRLKK